jgi:DNA polymerase III epsilon subunit-like protein
MSCTTEVERALVFDVETTGLFDKSGDITKQPYITQISFIVINIFKEAGMPIRYETEREYNHYIAIPDGVVIPPKVIKLTGITNEKCKKEGIQIEDALFEFYQEYVESNCIVSHNIDFDSKMIFIEMERNAKKVKDLGCWTPYAIFNTLFNRMHNIRIYCTMENGKSITNLVTYSRRTSAVSATCSTNSSASAVDFPPLPPTASLQVVRTYKKRPTLLELYTFLYPERTTPVGLHDSMVDTKVCMECYVKMIAYHQ